MLTAIADHLWQSTLCAAGAWLLTLALRKNRAAVRHGIWLAVSVKFLVPFSWLAAAGSRVGTRIVADIAVAPIPPAIEQLGRPFSPNVLEFTAAAAAPSTLVPAILFALWLCGLAINAIVWFGLWRRFRASLRGATPMPLDLPIPVMSTPGRQEPGVFGIRRPVLFLPEGIAGRMPPAQLQSILAHELCHVRRRDNLTGAIHMVVESIFWFFPLVWWIGSRLVEERELACDEEVVRLGNEPHTYAEGILSVCKLYASSPLACASGVTGADLKKGIEAIVNHRISLNLSFARKLLLAAAGAVVVAGPVVVGLINAQRGLAQSATPKFEVASIKPANPGASRMGYGSAPGGGFHAEGITLNMLVAHAYGIKDFQLSGGPGWANSERYDVIAKPSKDEQPASSEETAGSLERARLRTLLAERFQLVVRKETKELPVYTLVVAKGGSKLKESSLGSNSGVRGPDRGVIRGIGAQWEHLVRSLSVMLRRPVVDKTGFAGKRFDFELRFVEEPGMGRLPAKPGPAPGEAQESTETLGPSLFDALQSQLGLKLESAKGPVDFLFIERAEKPSAN